MANELTLSASLDFTKNSVTAELAKSALRVTVTGTKGIHSLQSIGTSAEALNIGDITTCGWCLMINRDATNYVTVRMGASGADLPKMKAGEFCCFRLAGNTPYLIANSAACEVEYVIVED